ncbi:MAG: hypothetical protein ACHQ50_05135 [Fimbriimonadales bacterium]
MRLLIATLGLVVLGIGAYGNGHGLTQRRYPPAEMQPRLVTSIWYLDGVESVRMVLSISETGTSYTARDVEDWAIQNEHRWQMSPADLTVLKKRVEALPKGETTMPNFYNRIVVYLGKDDKPRYYHAARIPPELKEIFRLGKGRLPRQY